MFGVGSFVTCFDKYKCENPSDPEKRGRRKWTILCINSGHLAPGMELMCIQCLNSVKIMKVTQRTNKSIDLIQTKAYEVSSELFVVVTSHTLLLTLTTFGVMLFWFISQCCQWQHNAVCCKTGCGGVDSFDGVSYSEFRSRTADRSWTPRPALCRYVCVCVRLEHDEARVWEWREPL